jgi:hypothetical protein
MARAETHCMDMSEYQEPLPTEVEQIEDEVRQALGDGPAPRSPEQGIEDMDKRIRYHEMMIRSYTHQMQMVATDQNRPEFLAAIENFKLRIKEARGRRYEYEIQLQNKN